MPCGKCAECRAKSQSEFAALSVLEAESAGSIGFITLTYDNDNLPIALSESDLDGQRIIGFQRGVGSGFAKDSVNRPIDKGGFAAVASLYRQDVQKFIKRYRQDYFRRFNKRLDFRFTFFGEYGERYHRPHYHMLVYGLNQSELNRLCSLWKYGFTDSKYITHFNSDGSDAYSKVSRYVSKYVGKRDFLPKFVVDGFAERPRKQSSIRLGVRDIPLDKLRNFT